MRNFKPQIKCMKLFVEVMPSSQWKLVGNLPEKVMAGGCGFWHIFWLGGRLMIKFYNVGCDFSGQGGSLFVIRQHG